MTIYESLVNFKEDNANEWDVKRSCSDGIVRITKTNPNRGKSLLELHFTEEEFIGLFKDEKEEYNNNYLISISIRGGSSYYGSVFVDDYYGEQEWKEGYILRHFDNENSERLQKILKMVGSTLKVSDNNEYEKIPKVLDTIYSRGGENLAYEYAQLYDECLVSGLRDYIYHKVCGVFNDFGIVEVTCAQKYYTTLNIFLRLWDESGISTDLETLEFFKEFIKKNNLEIDEDLWDDYYNYYDHKNFDDVTWQRLVSRYLDSIEEIIEDGDFVEEIGKNIEVLDFLEKNNIETGRYNSFPYEKTFGKSSNKKYVINSIENGKLMVTFMNLGDNQKMTMNLENFKTFLYHPELFD